MIETEFVVLALKKRAYSLVARNYILSAVVISTTLTLLGVRSVTNSMRHSYHSLFFLANTSNFCRN